MRISILAYLGAAGLAITAVVCRIAITPVIGEQGAYVTVFPAALLCGAWLGLGPAVLAAIVGVLGIEAFHAGDLDGPGLIVRSLVMIASAAMAGWLGAATRRPTQVAPILAPLPTPRPAPTPPAPAVPAEPKVTIDEAVALAEAAKKAKQRFVGQVSHELRTPILQAIAALERGSTGDARRELERELSLVDGLLDLTRLTNVRLQVFMRPIALHEILQQCARSCAEQLRSRSQKLTTEPGAQLDLVNGDPARLLQAFAAVIGNLAKLAPEQAVVTAATSNVSRKIRLSVEIPTGGIDPSALAQLFDPFGPINEQLGGLGIDLAIAKGLILLHGGTIKAVSEGSATRIEIVLPLLEKLPEDPTLFEEPLPVGA